MATTGGTAAPQIRVPAAAQALGAPKVTSVRAQPSSKGVTRAKMPGAPKGESRFLNRASGKMETARAMKAYVAPRSGSTPRAPSSSQPRSLPGAAPKAEKGFLEMNPAQLHHFVEKQVQSNTKAELQPYQDRGKEITGTEQTVAKRYGAYGEATQSLLGGIQQGAEAGAKTADNAAAQVAVKSQGEVNTAGQNAVTLTGGQLEPSVKAGTEAGATNIAGLGAAAQANAVSQGQNEANLLANIRAAAAQRVTEGQKGIASTYGKQRAENQGHEATVIGRQAGQISKLDTELGQKQFTDKATEAGLGIKQGTLGVAQQNAASKAAGVQGQERGRTITERQDQAKNALTERGQNITARYQSANIAEKERLDSVRISESASKIRANLARAKKDENPTTKPLTQTEANKLSTELGAAYNTVKNMREGGNTPVAIQEALTKGYYKAGGKEGKEGKNVKVPRVANQVLTKAALELWDYHKVSTATRAQMGKLGMNIGNDKEAFEAVEG